MPTATIRLRSHSHDALKEIADLTGQSLQDALERAIEDLRRKVYLEGLNSDYAALNNDPVASEALRKDIAEWDATGDGCSHYHEVSPNPIVSSRERTRRRSPKNQFHHL